MPPVAPEDVPNLIPGAPVPDAAHLTLATLWAAREMASRNTDPATLTGDHLTAYRTAVAAKSLAYKAGLGGAVTLTGTASGGGLKGIKLPGLELTLNPTTVDVHGNAQVATGEWDAYALAFLDLAAPRPARRAFAGVSR